MKNKILTISLMLLALGTKAVTFDSIKVKKSYPIKSVEIGIIKKGNDTAFVHDDTTTIRIGKIGIRINPKKVEITKDSSSKQVIHKHKNIENCWLGFDLGLCNYHVMNNFGSTFELRQSKSVNVKLYLIQQRINLIQHHVNFRWGLGVTWDNYRFNGNNKNTDLLKNKTDGTLYAINDSVNYTKNKFVTKYLTVPTMIEFSFGKKDSWKSFRLAAGLEFNLLLEGWQKQVSAERGKEHRFSGDYNLSQMPINYVVRLGVGKLNFFGTYALTPMFNTSQTSLTSSYILPKMYPWAIGIQLNGL